MAYKPRVLALTEGGTNASLTASNGGIVYSTASAAAILAGTATAGQVLRSGSSTTPSWSTATYPATAGTTGNVLTSDGTNWTSAAPAGGGAYSLYINSSSGNPADSTTYYMITQQAITAFTASSARTRSYIPFAGTLVSVYGAVGVAGTLGSAQTGTVAVRLNDTSNTDVSTSVSFTAATNTFSNSGLSLSLAAGDFVDFIVICPAWAPTNPTTVSITLTAYITT